MVLSARTAFLLAPFLGELAIQGIVWHQERGATSFEDGIAGVQMVMSAIPVHGGIANPLILAVFPVSCVLSWELLEIMRDHAPLGRLFGGKADWAAIVTGAVRRLFGLAVGTIGMLTLNVFFGLFAMMLLGAVTYMAFPDSAGAKLMAAIVGIAYPIPLGFLVLWAYRRISRPSGGRDGA